MVQMLKLNTHARWSHKPWLKMWVSIPRTSLCLTSVWRRWFLGTYGYYKPRDVLAVASMHRSAMSGILLSLYMATVLCNFNQPITGCTIGQSGRSTRDLYLGTQSHPTDNKKNNQSQASYLKFSI
jgi:hypothetical protein